MSKPELDIIRSQSAEVFLRSVTKGFYNRSYIALWLYEVIGREWDELREWSEGMRTEIHPQTCTWSIPIWEWVYGVEPDESLMLEERRRRVLAKVFGVKPINPESIRRGVSAVAGMDASVSDFTNPYGFGITLLPDIEAIPGDAILAAIRDGKITRYVREVKPAHLRVDIEFIMRVNAKPAVVWAVCAPVGMLMTVKAPPIHLAADPPRGLVRVHSGGGLAGRRCRMEARLSPPELPHHGAQGHIDAGGAYLGRTAHMTAHVAVPKTVAPVRASVQAKAAAGLAGMYQKIIREVPIYDTLE